jgi:NADH-quinone oxidoreductase subunit A
LALVVLVTVGMVGLSALLGERHRESATGEPYESGIVSAGSARVRFCSRFYLVAMFFVIFDLESVYIFAWATAAKELGWTGYWEVVVFVAVLLAALGYLWRVGALDFGPQLPRPPRTRGAPTKGVMA